MRSRSALIYQFLSAARARAQTQWAQAQLSGATIIIERNCNRRTCDKLRAIVRALKNWERVTLKISCLSAEERERIQFYWAHSRKWIHWMQCIVMEDKMPAELSRSKTAHKLLIDKECGKYHLSSVMHNSKIKKEVIWNIIWDTIIMYIVYIKSWKRHRMAFF